MFQRIATLSVAFLVLAAARAQANLAFERTSVNLGESRCGQRLQHRFTFINRGKSALKIITVKGSCGCLQPALDRKIYRPGERGSFLLKARTLGQPAGLQIWRVDVTYETDGKRYHEHVVMTATLIKEIHVDPSNLIIRAQDRIKHQVLLTDTRARPLTVAHLVTSAPFLQARQLGARRDQMGKHVQVMELIVDKEVPEGQRHETLTILTDDPQYRELTIPITITKESSGAVQAAPASVSFSGQRGKALGSRIVLLRGDGSEAVLVNRATSKHSAIQCRWAKGPGKMSTLRIIVDSSKIQSQQLKTSVEVRLKSPAGSNVIIPVRCELQ